MSETPKQVAERRARAICPVVCKVPCATCLFRAKAVATSDEQAGMVLVQDWQDIATAPINVTVWAYGTIPGDYGYTTDCKDMVKARKEPSGKWAFAQPMGRHDPMWWTPDAWMPLPPPPAAKEPRDG